MKLALLLPGYLDSPDYLHMKIFEKKLLGLGYVVERLDPCSLWETGDTKNYTITNFIQQIIDRVHYYKTQAPEEIVLIGHSMGAFTAIIAGSMTQEVTKIVALCPPPDSKGSAKQWGGQAYRVSKRDLPDNPQKVREFAVPYSFVQDRSKYSAIEEVAHIHKPIMIFIALEDKTVIPERTEELVSKAHNPHVVRQPGMGHDFRHSARECEIVMKEIEKFLEG